MYTAGSIVTLFSSGFGVTVNEQEIAVGTTLINSPDASMFVFEGAIPVRLGQDAAVGPFGILVTKIQPCVSQGMASLTGCRITAAVEGTTDYLCDKDD